MASNKYHHIPKKLLSILVIEAALLSFATIIGGGRIVDFIGALIGSQLSALLCALMIKLIIMRSKKQGETSPNSSQENTKPIGGTLLVTGCLVLIFGIFIGWQLYVYPHVLTEVVNKYGTNGTATIDRYGLFQHDTGPTGGYGYELRVYNIDEAEYIVATIHYDNRTQKMKIYRGYPEFNILYNAARYSESIKVRYLTVAPAFVRIQK